MCYRIRSYESFDMTPQVLVACGTADKWLVDPPREGAFALVKALTDLHQQKLGPQMLHPLRVLRIGHPSVLFT